jgi:uncharacterized protein (TIGR02145 family)
MARRLSHIILISGLLCIALSGCEKGEDPPPPVTDVDGNVYETVMIGNQVWMAENLRTTRLNDGSEIELITKNKDWNTTSDPAFCWYNNDSSLFKVPYGALYNGFAATNEKICPAGWHVPDSEEWNQLIDNLGNAETAGGKLKLEGITQWHPPNTGADNSSSFSALPAGLRYFEGTFSSLSYFTAFWSVNEADNASHYFLSLSYLDSKATLSNKSKKHGFSIRCIRD